MQSDCLFQLFCTLLAFCQIPKSDMTISEDATDLNTFLVSFLESDETDQFSIRLTALEFFEEIARNKQLGEQILTWLRDNFNSTEFVKPEPVSFGNLDVQM